MISEVPDYLLVLLALLALAAVAWSLALRRREREALRRAEITEAQARAAEAQASIVSQVKDHAIFMIDLAGRAVTWNAGVERVTGFAEDAFLGRDSRELFTPEDRESGIPERELAHARDHGAASNDRWMVRKDGTRFWASGMTTRMVDAEGRLIGFAKIMRDLTQERQIEDALRRSEERYRFATRATREAIWEWDPATNSLTFSDGLQELFGYTLTESGPTLDWWAERIHPDDRERIVTSLHAAAAAAELFWAAEYRFHHASGRYVTVEDRGYLILDESKQPIRMIGSMADVTERRRVEENLQQAQRMEAVGRLAGGVAHDLNNMLVAIIGYSEFVARSLPEGDRRRDDIEQVVRAAHRSATLARQLLAFARREAVRPTVFGLNAMVTDMQGMLQSVLGESITLELQLAPNLASLRADRGQVEQALLNLVLNARDAMPQGGRLTIQTGELELDAGEAAREPEGDVAPGRYVQLVVSDTGTGMDRETLAQAFEPFFTTKPVGQGTGLGLASVYGSVKQGRGFVRAYSEPGVGSVFRLAYPAADAGRDGTARVAEQAPAARDGIPSTETILLVEDEEVVLRFASDLLRREGHTCLEARTGDDALELLARHAGPLHLVISDVVLPGLNGRALAERIAGIRPGVPLLYMSAFTSDEAVQRGLLDASAPFIQKPFRPDEFVHRVRMLLDEAPRAH